MHLEKAYDWKALVAELKTAGLDLGEDAAKKVLESVLVWVEESAKLSATPYDDMGLIVLPKLKEMALAQVDKIDGQVG
jgi:hypothetical protein